MASRRSVPVKIRGKVYKIRTDDDEESLQRVALFLDETMAKVEARTGTVDTLDAALLTALNLAREIVAVREGRKSGGVAGVDADRLRNLVELAESGLAYTPAGH